MGAHGKHLHHNHVFTWKVGKKEETDRVFGPAKNTVAEGMIYQRVHPVLTDTCGCVASIDKVNGKLTVYITSQAPNVVRTVVSMLLGIAESRIRVISPDIGGGFGNKVGVYPGYVASIAASVELGRPVKWVEYRIENISTTAFAQDYHMIGELAADRDAKIKGLRVDVIADHGVFDACVDPSMFPAGLFAIVTGARTWAVVWLNPLLGREGYEPVANGMQAALRVVDLFARANNLNSLAALEPNLVDL